MFVALVPALTTRISIFRNLCYRCCVLRSLPGRVGTYLVLVFFFGHTWYHCYIIILSNGTVPDAGCGDGGLVNATADAGGLSGSDGDDGKTAHWYWEKERILCTWDLICGLTELSYRVWGYRYDGIGYDVRSRRLKYCEFYEERDGYLHQTCFCTHKTCYIWLARWILCKIGM
jgi:hypothetical protein